MRLFNFATLRRQRTRLPAPPSAAERSVHTFIGTRQYHITSDDNYLDHISGVFEADVVALFTSLLRRGDVVLDVGANIGCTSLLFSQYARKVFSFEPSPSTFALLQRNLDAAGAANVVATNVGLGKGEGACELTFARDNRAGGFVSDRMAASSGHAIEEIRIVAGDAYLGEAGVGHVDFIKIDVEGFERHVIEGLEQTIVRCRPVVVLELNHWCLNAFQRTSVPDFFDYLRGVFPLLYAVDGNDRRDLHNPDDAYHVMYHHIVNNFRYPNLVGAFDNTRLPAPARQ
jgi:FkbM family methyltransferase